MAPLPADIHTLAGNADSVEFCPIEGFKHLLAAATYNLVEGEVPKRLGQVYLFDAGASLSDPTEPPRMRKVFERDTCGVFDLKWSPQSLHSAPCLGQASADGSLSFYTLTDAESPSLDLTAECRVGEAMSLSMDWQPETTEQVVTSQSDRQIATVDLNPPSPCVSHSWDAHSLEVWVACFDRWDANLVYSGADDCAMKGWDIRTDCNAPVFSNSREHSMGVCTIASDSRKEHQFVSGSYDERVRVWDNRNLRRPICKHVGAQVGGGVWRLKWHPHRPGILLGACMHGGARVFDVADDGVVSVLEEYVTHGSLTYGADWCYQQTDKSGHPETLSFAEECAEPVKPVHAEGKGPSVLKSLKQDESYAANSSGVVVGREHSLGQSTSNVDRNVQPSVGGSFSQTVVDSVTCRAQRDSREPSSQPLLRSLVATCSFYDRSLHLWEPTFKERTSNGKPETGTRI